MWYRLKACYSKAGDSSAKAPSLASAYGGDVVRKYDARSRATCYARRMKMLMPRFVLLSLTALLAACAATGPRLSEDSTMFYALRISEHRDGDDLLTAGLGLAGLRSPVAPAFADPAHPTPAELRRRAIWSNWRGIADLAPGGGYGEWYGRVDTVVGAEFQSLATVPGATQPHRVLVQVPDAFSQSRRCLVVTASSGSRGIYGAIAVAGAWGLAKGCAVAYTDKGAGTDYFDLDAGLGVGIDGTARRRDRWYLRPSRSPVAAWPSSTRIRATTRRPTGAST